MKLINGYYKIVTVVNLCLKRILYGSKFKCGKISTRKNFKILVEKGGELTIGQGCFLTMIALLHA